VSHFKENGELAERLTKMTGSF